MFQSLLDCCYRSACPLIKSALHALVIQRASGGSGWLLHEYSLNSNLWLCTLDLETLLWLASYVPLSQTFRALAANSNSEEALTLYSRQGVQARSECSSSESLNQNQEGCMSYLPWVCLEICSNYLTISLSFLKNSSQNSQWGCQSSDQYSMEGLCIHAHHYWVRSGIMSIFPSVLSL